MLKYCLVHGDSQRNIFSKYVNKWGSYHIFFNYWRAATYIVFSEIYVFVHTKLKELFFSPQVMIFLRESLWRTLWFLCLTSPLARGLRLCAWAASTCWCSCLSPVPCSNWPPGLASRFTAASCRGSRPWGKGPSTATLSMSRPYELTDRSCLKLHTDTFSRPSYNHFCNGWEEYEGCSDVNTLQPSLMNHCTTCGSVKSEKKKKKMHSRLSNPAGKNMKLHFQILNLPYFLY